VDSYQICMVFPMESFHEDMQAGIFVSDDVAQVMVSNDLRQGCVLALV